jgi:hypothetical protein
MLTNTSRTLIKETKIEIKVHHSVLIISKNLLFKFIE